MLATGLRSFPRSEERGEARQPLLAACHQVAGRERVSELLEAFRRCTLDEGVGALFEGDALLAHPVGEPVMLIETDSSGERKIGTQADEHPSPPAVIDIEIILNDPAIGDLKMPSVRLAVADCSQNARRFARFEDDDHRIRAGPLEIGSDEVIAAAIRRLENRDLPFL